VTYNRVELRELEVAAHQALSGTAQLHGHGRRAGAGATDHGAVRDESPNEGKSSNKAGGGLHGYSSEVGREGAAGLYNIRSQNHANNNHKNTISV